MAELTPCFTLALRGFKVVPYVRMTQRSKFVDKRAIAYRKNQEDLGMYLKAYGRGSLDTFPVKYFLRMTLTSPRHLAADHDNYVKAVLDACTKAHLFKDDNLRYISGSHGVDIGLGDELTLELFFYPDQLRQTTRAGGGRGGGEVVT